MIGLARQLSCTVALLLASASAASAQVGVALVDAVPSITIEGEAKRDVAPDLAFVTMGVTTDRPTAAQASADNAHASAALVAAARAAGLGDADIRTSELRLLAISDPRDPSKIKAFRSSHQVTMRTRDLDRLGSLVGQLTAQGANTIEGIDFSVAEPQPILDDLSAKATQEAVRKAGIYATAAGLKLGRVLRIAPTGGEPAPMARAFKLQMDAPAPAPPIEAGAQQLASRVQITWELIP